MNVLTLLAGLIAADSIRLSALDLSNVIQGWGNPGRDRAVEGHPLSIGGHPYAFGLGTHSPSKMAIDLHGSATHFHAEVGIDDEVPEGKGSVEFEIVANNGDLLWKSPLKRRGEPATTVDLDLRGRTAMMLVVTMGGDGFDFDHADWAAATIEYSDQAPTSIPLHPNRGKGQAVNNAWESEDLPVTVAALPSRPEVTGPLLVGSVAGSAFNWRIPVYGAGPLRFTSGRLPITLSLDPETGILRGKTPRPGKYRIPVNVDNRYGTRKIEIELDAGSRVALTPPMGWNSYDGFGDNVTETETMANARFLADRLAPFGWNTAVVDYRWYDPGAHDNNANGRFGAALTMDGYGRLLPSPNRFPSAGDGYGFRALADKIHTLGLQFGIHIMRGIPRMAVTQNCPIEGSTFSARDAADEADKCPWCPDMYGVRGSTPAGQAYYDSIFRLYASWGVDFVKMDDTSSPYHRDEIDAVRRAIDRCGRSIVYSLSPGETPAQDAEHVSAKANMWRVSGDFWDNWSSLDHEFELASRWASRVGPGHWPDADMIPFGHLSVHGRSVGPDRITQFTRNEQVTLMSLWCLVGSPLMLGGNLPDLDPGTINLLTNEMAISIDQDPDGNSPVHEATKGDIEVWTRHLRGGAIAIGFFNRGDWTETANFPANLPPLRAATNVWLRARSSRLPQGGIRIPAHGAFLFKLEPE